MLDASFVYQCSLVTLGLDGTIVELEAIKASRTIIPKDNQKKNTVVYL